MEHYVGLDVSLKLTAICIVDRTGKIEREGVVSSDPEAIAIFIKSHAPHVARVGLETGANRASPSRSTDLLGQTSQASKTRRVPVYERNSLAGISALAIS
jgi:hypothetical protein